MKIICINLTKECKRMYIFIKHDLITNEKPLIRILNEDIVKSNEGGI